MKSYQLSIEGMSCGHCVRAVKDALEGVAGVERVEVEIGSARVEVQDDVPYQLLVAAVEQEDYRVVASA